MGFPSPTPASALVWALGVTNGSRTEAWHYFWFQEWREHLTVLELGLLLLVPQGHHKPWLPWWTRHILSEPPFSFAKGCRIKYPWSLGEELWKEVFENHNVSVQFEFSIPLIVESELKCVYTCAHLQAHTHTHSQDAHTTTTAWYRVDHLCLLSSVWKGKKHFSLQNDHPELLTDSWLYVFIFVLFCLVLHFLRQDFYV